MKLTTTRKLQLLSLVGLLLITTGLRCKFITPKQRELLEPVELSWWGTANTAADLQEVIGNYEAQHPNISIRYRQLRPEEFDLELLNALAEDRGPDIFSIRNTQVPIYNSKIAPMPGKTTIAYEVTQKSLGIKEETLIEIRDEQSLTVGELKSFFVDVVSDDVVRDNKIFALPFSVNTLVLFYNRDLLNNAGIPLAATTWQELQEHVQRLTFQDTDGNLLQSGAALGSSHNISYSPDIISLLMMQNGAQMTDNNRHATFNNVPPGGDRTYNPGPAAVQFYTDFANPGKEVYTWNYGMPNSIEAFVQGKVAYLFGYSGEIKTITDKRQGKLNYGITGVPQIENRPAVNFASYTVHTVSAKSVHLNEAWNFLQFASRKDEVRKYLAKTGQPTALRSLIEEQRGNDQLKIFADQLLTAKSWYHGHDIGATENAFREMVDSILLRNSELQAAVTFAAQRISQTL